MKNYSNFSKMRNETSQENNAEQAQEKRVLTDQAEKIKEKIKEQEEKIQALKNSVSIYFINKCRFVNLREEQSKESLVMAVLENGTLIEPIIYNDTTEWTKVKYKEKYGYIMTKYIGVEVSEPIE